MCDVIHSDIASAFSETISCRYLEKKVFFKQWRFNWVQKPYCSQRETSLFGTLQNCCYKEVLWIGCLLENEIRPKLLGKFDCFELSYYPLNHQKAEVFEIQADGTLFYCSPLFGIRYNPSVRKLLFYMALCSITNMYMWYWCITIYIAITQEQ